MDEEAMVKEHQGLVHMVARRYRIPKGVDYEDLVQVGMIGLLEAIREFDPSLGFKFSTFAVPRINARIYKHIRVLSAAKRKGNVISIETVVYDDVSLFEIIEEPSANVEDQAVANYIRDQLLKKEPKIVQMKLSGYTQEEIAREIGVSQ